MPVGRARTQMVKFRRWFFEVGTRLVELLSAALLLSFSSRFIFNYTGMVARYPYQHFSQTKTVWIFVAIAAFALLQIYVACQHSLRSNFASGACALCSGAIFAWFSFNFLAEKPPITAVGTYAIMAVICFITGFEILSRCRKIDPMTT